jgi:hypothetical protein
VISGRSEEKQVALERISRYFDLIEIRESDGYWAARVGNNAMRSGTRR